VTEGVQLGVARGYDPEFDGQDATAGPPPTAGPPGDASSRARAERATADARYQDFVASGDPCEGVTEPKHPDACVHEAIGNAVLFEREGADADAVDAADVKQGKMGDCHLLAPLAALASTPRGRALLRGAIVENRNDKGEVVSWTVTLHKPEPHLLWKTTFREVSVTVAGPYVVGHAVPRSENGQNEIWPAIIEKAYAQYAGGYDKIANGGLPTDAIAILTGQEATYHSLAWPQRWLARYSGDDLRADLANGKIVILSTRPGIEGHGRPAPANGRVAPDVHGLLEDHAYFVTGTMERDGRLFVKMGNPWGEDPPDLVPFDEFATWFSGISVGSVP
jgi:Calpain family cysteine protease